MARRPEARPQLIALEGTRGVDLRKAARTIRQRAAAGKVKAGVSWWDASGVFFEVGLGKRKHRAASPRTLLLLYAADLAFRLRWEIRPALEAGRSVVAAPYLDTALAFGRACGLPRAWLASLFAFAPAPDASYFVQERRKSTGWKANARDGFAEFSSAVIAGLSPSFAQADVRREMIAALGSAVRRRGGRRLT